MDEKEYNWLKERKKGLGGSDASIVLGVNPWRSRLELWNDKTTDVIKTADFIDNLELDIDTGNVNFKWGKILEPVIINEYKNITGRKVIIDVEQMTSEQYPFMNANLDGIVIDKNKGVGVLEVKTKGAFIKWDSEIPIYYMIQMQHYLAVTGFKYASFTVLDFGKKELLWYDVNRDEELIKKIIDEELKFWDLVVTKIPPQIDSSKSCEEFLRNKYSIETEGKKIDLTQNDIAKKNALLLQFVKNQQKKLDDEEREYKNVLMSIMGDAEVGVGDKYKITWKSPKDKVIFDVDKFKNEYPELYNKYISTEKQTRRFTVKFVD